TPATGPANPASLALQAAPAAYQLPAAISREVVLTDGSRLVIAGGLTRQARQTWVRAGPSLQPR
ncbi:MAG TPA: hypothetical protein VE733_17545, partial [Streptosporangiaceae bacterium]|nr:hypothetical protein [Streptosporangiaceae bacterium]